MGLLDQYDKAKLYAKGLLGRVAQNYEDLQNSPQKIAGLLSNVPSNAQSMYQGLLGAPAQVADLFSQQKAQQLAQALQKPQQANPQQWMDAGMELSGMAPLGGLMAHTVYHGSPHKFDKFDMSKIGTGEGKQQQGVGLYFAESKDVGQRYADRLADMHGKAEGNLYKVDLPDDAVSKFANYETSFMQQPESVRNAVAPLITDDVMHNLKGYYGWESIDDAPMAAIMGALDISNGNSRAAVTDAFKKSGIPGIRYLDGGSRGAGQGTSNFVLFDDQLARILERNGQPTGLLPWQEGEWLNLNRGLPGKMDNVPDMTYQIDHKPMSVKSGASTLNDLTKAFGNDIYGPNALRYFGSGDPAERRILRIMQQMKGKPDQMVTIYRGVPPDVNAINPGDWVTLDKDVASLYADPTAYGGTSPGKVLQMQVPAKHITSWPDSLLEFGYFPDK